MSVIVSMRTIFSNMSGAHKNTAMTYLAGCTLLGVINARNNDGSKSIDRYIKGGLSGFALGLFWPISAIIAIPKVVGVTSVWQCPECKNMRAWSWSEELMMHMPKNRDKLVVIATCEACCAKYRAGYIAK